jgi:hypothetical protein
LEKKKKKKKKVKKERFFLKPAQNETVAGGWPIQSCSPSKTGMVQSWLWFTQALTH